MVATAKFAAETRDRIHNLDMTIPQHEEIYENNLRQFIEENEGVHRWAYDDATGKEVRAGKGIKGNVTIGIGFNMSKIEAQKEWNKAFEGEVDFKEVYNGKRCLTQKEIDKLYSYNFHENRKYIRSHFKDSWEKLKPNERLTIEDLTWQSYSLISSKTNFNKYLQEYVRTSDTEYLLKAIEEVRQRSNPKKIPGVKNRRDAQAIMLSSQECPVSIKPNESVIPSEETLKVRAKLAETIIPRDPYDFSFVNYVRYGIPPTTRPFTTFESINYYIWRTKCDEKVRESHAANEGKIFDVNQPLLEGFPGQAYNCRCKADFNIPYWVEVMQ